QSPDSPTTRSVRLPSRPSPPPGAVGLSRSASPRAAVHPPPCARSPPPPSAASRQGSEKDRSRKVRPPPPHPAIRTYPSHAHIPQGPVPAFPEHFVALGLLHNADPELAHRLKLRHPQGARERVRRAQVRDLRHLAHKPQKRLLRQLRLKGVEAADAQKPREEQRRGDLRGGCLRPLTFIAHATKPLTQVVDVPPVGHNLTKTSRAEPVRVRLGVGGGGLSEGRVRFPSAVALGAWPEAEVGSGDRASEANGPSHPPARVEAGPVWPS